MTVFVDTSALYAVLDRDDANHHAARETWRRLLLDPSAVLLTHNYVLVETAALLQNRRGIDVVRTLHEKVVPMIRIDWLDEQRHRVAIEMLLTAAREKLSLVDCASFLVMRDHAVTRAFCFDRQFAEQGFQPLP
jgi:predicted nucleic acid-binding protein